MSFRAWLAIAFVLAFGASPAHAETASGVLAITLDQAKIAKLPAGTATLIIGTPMIADGTMLESSGSMVITGKGFCATHPIPAPSHGPAIAEEHSPLSP